ncbi:hypothetical protein PTSG_04170 [Salpingoeca rosetta]|uniref:CHCH domain-containing protein n=1 Tax=Salpingoeca rosetta (strain ATCC 50818 / BSB-021) TaxID=946362 RepID=F2U6T3_SALR5|nr:uncharacterized protein PTSG_04170 [Salpingoeca rosetta]EGD83565.1 hypothetical protein PTSG_04170 [Salpingoeca rosetta]|eukprot:XP_004995069.1 hypothetical protein PTSG_04170 [Salpingoeca rosetta]
MRGRTQPMKLIAGRPLRGPGRVASAARAAEVGCQHQMDKLFDCWKRNDFDDTQCSKLIHAYMRCLSQQSRVSRSTPLDMRSAMKEVDQPR